MGWGKDHFGGLGELESEVQLCLTSGEWLKAKTCLSTPFPEVCHMGELVEGDLVTLRRKVVWGSWWKLLSVSWMSNEHGREAVQLQRLREVGMWGSSRRAFSRKLAWRPCFQKKIVIWENWWWAKAWAVGDQGAWGIMVADQPAVAGFHHIFCRPAHCTTPVTPLIVYPVSVPNFANKLIFFKYEHFFNKNTSKIRRKYEQNRTNLRAKLKFLF